MSTNNKRSLEETVTMGPPNKRMKPVIPTPQDDDDNIYFKAIKQNGHSYLSNFFPDVSEKSFEAVFAAVSKLTYITCTREQLKDCSFELDGKRFKTPEHAYQYSRWVDSYPEEAEKIRLCETSLDAKKMNTALKKKYGSVNKTKLELIANMKRVVYAKFDQNVHLHQLLIQTTGMAKLHESGGRSPSMWAFNKSAPFNDDQLGKILMEVREEIAEEIFLSRW
jgi:predicted NAD-dependent protein-ADP-ribosyltransferase YbiA (DUF1768 family)